MDTSSVSEIQLLGALVHTTFPPWSRISAYTQNRTIMEAFSRARVRALTQCDQMPGSAQHLIVSQCQPGL